jgi:hypothetical protein
MVDPMVCRRAAIYRNSLPTPAFRRIAMSGIPQLERIVFYPGELLTADDLTTLDGNSRALRWLHNRSLHNWGIGIGLDINGNRGDTSVTVNPGYSIDSLGREIILSSPVQQPIPAVSGPATYYLVANYVGDADEPVEEQRSATACAPGGAVRLSDAPAIRWKSSNQLTFTSDVVLAQVSIQNCVLSQSPSGAVRRYASCGSPFFIKAGQLAAQDIAWKPWTPAGINFGFTGPVDTSAAQFQSTPRYMVQIAGSRSSGGASPTVILDLVSIADESPGGFTLQVALPSLPGVNPALDAIGWKNLVNSLGWTISWVGVEA